MVVKISFPTLSNVDIQIVEKKLVGSTYTTTKTPSTTRKIELVDKIDFAKVALNKYVETFVVYVSSLSLGLMTIHLAWEAQMASLLIEKVTIPRECIDCTNIFLHKLTKVLP